MTSSPHLCMSTAAQRGQIVGLHQAHTPVKTIEAITGVNSKTVEGIITRYNKRGNVNEVQKSGRPPIVTPRGKRQILKDITNHPFDTVQTIAAKQPYRVSPSTIRKVAGSEQKHRRIARRKPHLSEKQMQTRLQWARAHEHWTDDDWNKVIWTDESIVERGEIKHKRYVWRSPGEQDDDDKIIGTYKSGRFTVGIWGAIDMHAKLGMKILHLPGTRTKNKVVVDKGGFTAQRYIDQILEPLAKTIYTRKQLKDGDAIWMEDNAPTHKAAVVTQYRRLYRMKMLRHPPNSPDLNPIEYVWGWIKHKLELDIRIPNTKTELSERITHYWDILPQSELKSFTRTMKDRVKSVIEAKGGHTRY
jgi:transposase